MKKMTNDNKGNDEDDEENIIATKRLKTEHVNGVHYFKDYTKEDETGIEKAPVSHFFEELFDNYEDAMPYDLSTKQKPEEISTVSSEYCKSSIDFTRKTIMEHFTKIQQTFLSNLVQYQANILAHFQQIQQQLIMKEGNCKDSSIKEEASDTSSNIDEDEQYQLPQPYDIFSILKNLIYFSLYPNLLPNALTLGSDLPPLNVSLSDSSKLSTSSLSPKSHDDESTQCDEQLMSGVSALKHYLIANSPSQVTIESSSLTQVVASSNKLDSKTNANELEENTEFGSSRLQYKRKRIAFSAKQYELLQTTFEHNNFPEPADQQCIANQLSAPYRSIKMWFQNKRANARKKLMPGEKGSGRTLNGEKIPGDTDTRFYCDKCPSAFICQKYLNNHTHIHSLYTKKCPKCCIVFTNDCLLNTHIKAKCSSNKDIRMNQLANNETEVIAESFVKIESDYETQMEAKESEDEIPSSILSRLGSRLPLLTLLQIQKKQEEHKKLQELSEGYASEAENSDSCSDDERNNDSDEYGSRMKSDLPPLIPTNLVDPVLCDSKFAILRHLLTNLAIHKSMNMNEIKTEEDIPMTALKQYEIPCDERSVVETIPKLAQNIPKQKLLNDNKGSCKLETETEADEHLVETPMSSDTDSLSQTSKKRKVECDENKFVHRPKAKRLRRRTTVFTEAQHRILYLHFTHCNFPDPTMFRILSKLTELTPHVIKIWFQNERSRQRRQVSLTECEVSGTKEKKPYKCRDCGVEFAMPAFLVKHCMRHIPTDNVTSQARKCPICMVEFETQKLHSHFMASHNLSISLEEEGSNEKNMCHLCQELYPDLNALSTHKFEHLHDIHYGDPPQCSECRTTFVNVLCLEAHMATHQKFAWDHTCTKCQLSFYDKILLESHIMSHSLNNSVTSPSSLTTLSSLVEKSEPKELKNQYFLSLQQLSESEHKLIKPKMEPVDSSDLLGVDAEIIHKNGNCSSSSIADTSPPSPSKKLNFKIIPVKFIPVSMNSNEIKNTSIGTIKPLVALVSPQLIAIKKENVVDNHCNSQKKKMSIIESLMEPAKEIQKRVPNLIPISDAAFPFKIERESVSDDDVANIPATIKLTELTDEVNGSNLYTPYSEYRKRRRTPTHFNSSQRDILEAYYKYDNFPDPNEQLHLSEYLQVQYSVIKTWFQNTRKNHRKHLKISSSTDISGPFECSKCRVCFVSKIYIDSHLKQHDEPQPHICSSCQLQFPHLAIYDIHSTMGCASKKSKKKHDNLRQLQTYGHNFTSQSSLGVSDESTNFKIVSVQFDESGKVDVVPFYDCSQCSTKFTSPNTLSEHLKNERSNDSFLESNKDYAPKIIDYTCPHCDKSFASIAEHNLRSNCSFNQLEANDDEGTTTIDADEVSSSSERNNDPSDITNLPSDAQNGSKLKKILLSPLNCGVSRICKLSFSPLFDLLSSLRVPVPSSKTNNSDDVCLSVTNPNISPTKLIPIKSKKKHNFALADNDILTLHYDFNNFPSSTEINTIAKRLKVEKERVAHWFQIHRSRERKGMAVEYQSPHPCRSCSSVFVHLEALQQHENSVHDSTTICVQFICPFEKCGAKLPNSTLLQTHQMTHLDHESTDEKDLKSHGGYLEAHYIENNFPSSTDLGFIGRRLHLESVGIHWWFKERRARHVISIEKMLKERNVNVSKTKTVSTTKQCEVCGAAFLDQRDYEEHLCIHSSDASLLCIECAADFANPLVLETHMHHHGIDTNGDLLSLSKIIESNGEVKFTFLQLQVLLNHFKHSNFPPKEEMKQISRRIKIPMKHILSWFSHQRSAPPRIVHNLKTNLCTAVVKPNPNSSSVLCILCRSQFVSLQHIRTHNAVHKKGSTLSCDICNANFLHKTTLETHKLAHFSGTGLKIQTKMLEKRLKEFIRKLINDSSDVASFSTSYSGFTDYKDDLRDNDDQSVSRGQSGSSIGYLSQTNQNGSVEEIADFCEENSNGGCENLSPSIDESDDFQLKDSSSSILQIDHIDEDSFTEEEDDELKLVIDE